MPGSIIGAGLNFLSAGDAGDSQAAAAAGANKTQKAMYDQTRKDLAPYRDIGNAGAYTLAQLLGLYNPNAVTSTSTVLGNVPEEEPLPKGNQRFDTPFGKVILAPDGTFKKGKPEALEYYNTNIKKPAPVAAPVDSTPPANFGSLLQMFDADKFQKDPGYNFRLQEGEKALNRTLAAQGGLLSGAAIKAANRYNQDYATNEYTNAYNRYNNDQNTIYNRLMGVSNMGQNAAAQQASQNQSYANQVGQNMMNFGDARANQAINQGYFAGQGLAGMMGSQYSGGAFGGGQTHTNSPYGTINWYR